jgi:hypothetical protein
MIQRALGDCMTGAIIGPVTLEDWLNGAPAIRRHLFDTPRRRLRQTNALACYGLLGAAQLLC